MDLARKIFRIFNKLFMVPMFRLGFGPFMGNPITGYIMVIKHIGRKSGKQRFTPVNYAIIDGTVYCIAGYGVKAHWYMNVTARPLVELIMPGGAISASAETVTDPQLKLIAIRQIFRNAGFAGFFEGYNPYTASDEVFKKTLERCPVLRLRPTGIGSGACDPGGRLWISLTVITVIILLLFFA